VLLQVLGGLSASGKEGKRVEKLLFYFSSSFFPLLEGVFLWVIWGGFWRVFGGRLEGKCSDCEMLNERSPYIDRAC
jgi:hypothetical protein